jgi:D-3-phosphoglycerate dehydrogenase / 2-oxoglutarate reductase
MTQETFRILIADALAPEGLEILAREPALQVDEQTKLTVDELTQAIKGADAIIVRSGTRVTAAIIAASDQLKVIGRAGVGLDNVDVPAASKRGIIAMNVPSGNTISTAEHAFSLLVALSRNIPQAHADLKRGEWNRKKYTGVELYGKTLGIIGLGKIGAEVAKRALAFGMHIIAYDPFMTKERAQQLDITLAGFDETLQLADYITVHTPLTPETKHLISTKEFGLMKDGVRVINCARGGIIDEAALEAAIDAGKVAGAALDVFEQEPPVCTSLIGKPSVIVTPHLGASTTEAQVNVAIQMAEQVRDALLGRGVRNAVNMMSLDPKTLEVLQPYIDLAERLGQLVCQLADGSVEEVKLTYIGDPALRETSPITVSFLKGLLTSQVGEAVNYVNAAILASDRGIKVIEAKSSTAKDFANLMTIEARTPMATLVVHGTLFTRRDPRIVRLDQFRLDAVPEGHLLIIRHIDQPGIVAHVGTLMAKANINIAGLTVGRTEERGAAISVINLDSDLPADLIEQIKSHENILDAKIITL